MSLAEYILQILVWKDLFPSLLKCVSKQGRALAAPFRFPFFWALSVILHSGDFAACEVCEGISVVQGSLEISA